MLSVLLRYTDSDYTFGIFKPFLQRTIHRTLSGFCFDILYFLCFRPIYDYEVLDYEVLDYEVLDDEEPEVSDLLQALSQKLIIYFFVHSF